MGRNKEPLKKDFTGTEDIDNGIGYKIKSNAKRSLKSYSFHFLRKVWDWS